MSGRVRWPDAGGRFCPVVGQRACDRAALRMASRLLFGVGSHKGEDLMTMSMSGPLPGSGPKRMMKVLCPVEKEGEKKATYWIRCGTAFWNRDQSINLYIDVLPLNGKLQLRELDEDDLREKGGRRGERATVPHLEPVND